MKSSPSWEDTSLSATQEFPNILPNPKVYYRVHKSLPLVPILRHTNSVHKIQSYFFKVDFNIILLLTSTSS
jgi:hypothetical protein